MVANSIRNAIMAANMINKFKLVYLYNKNDKNIFELLSLPEGVPILANTEEEAKYIRFSPEFIRAAPPVGSSKACSVLLVQVIAYFSSVSAEFRRPPVLAMCWGS